MIGAVARGALALVGVEPGDDAETVADLAAKMRYLRIFEDAEGRMNLDCAQVGGAVLLVSQFTLAADTRRGRRPSFSTAAPPEEAEPLITQLVATLRAHGLEVEEGRFGALMSVELVNEGPVTMLLESGPGSATK